MLFQPPRSPQPVRAAIALAGVCALAACAAPQGDGSRAGAQGAQNQAPTERYDAQAIRTVQRRLDELGYAAGPVDGAYGPATRSGILAFQRDHGMQATGKPTQRLITALKKAEPRRTPGKTPDPTRTADAGDTAEDASEGEPSAAEAAGTDDEPVSLRVPEDEVATAEEAPDAADAPAEAGATQAAADTDAAAGSPEETVADGAEAPATAGENAGTEKAAQAAGDAGSGNNAAVQKSQGQQADAGGETGGTAAPDLSEIDLAGTRWRLVGGPNRAIQITLKPDGDVEAPVGDWSWTRDGREIQLTFDSGTRSRSERTGELVSRDRIEGTGKDTFGRSWDWHASRVSRSAANR